MAATISRTWYNTLVDDSGSNTDGTIWDKAAVNSLLNAIDSLMAGNLGAITATTLGLTDTGAGLSITQTTSPGNLTAETFVAGFGYDATSALQKQWSLSGIWADTTHASGYNVLRLNATYMSAGVEVDDLFLRGWGNNGSAFFAAASTAAHAPGLHVLKVRGRQHVGDFDNDVTVGGFGAVKPSITGGAGATTLKTAIGSEGSWYLVSGYTATGNKRFAETILACGSDTTGVSVIGTAREVNTPAARTYSVAAETLKLSLAGTDVYTVRVTAIGDVESNA